ncbi:MAG: sugar ABC transporter permease [Lysobacteraceae bacterium]
MIKYSKSTKNNLIAYCFLLPYLLVFIIFRMGPSIAGFFISLTEWNIIGDVHFIGFENFVKLLQSSNFYVSLRNTGAFVALAVPFLTVGSLLMAILLNQKILGIGIVRAISIIPYVLIPAVVGVLWNWIYAYNFGILNYYLKTLSINPKGWLIDSSYALSAVSIVIIWSYLGYNTVLYLAGLQSIPTELTDASMIDGCNKIQSFMKISLPILQPITSLVITLTVINVVQCFDLIYVMTNGGPGTSTLTLVQYLYSSGFKDYKMGYASAVGTIIVLLLVIMMLGKKGLSREEEIL